MPRERSKERTRRSGSPRNQPDRNRHERDRQDSQRGNQQYQQPPRQRPAGNVPSRDRDLQLPPLLLGRNAPQQQAARDREDADRRAYEEYASQQRSAYAPNSAPSPYSQQQPRPSYPQQAQYTAPPSGFDMSSLTTSLAPGQERGLTAFAGPPGLSRPPGPSAGDQSHSSAQPKNRMDISAIIDSPEASGEENSSRSNKPHEKRIEVNSLLGPESPRRGKDRSSPSNEPPKKRAAVASRSKDKAQPKEKVTSSRSRPPPSGSKQSANLPRDEPVPRVEDPRYTADKELELRAIKFLSPRIRDGDIAKKLGESFDAASVRQQLNRIGRDIYAPPARDWNDNDNGRAMAMMDAGDSRRTIARELNRTDEDVGAQLGRLEELRRARGRGYFTEYKPREGGT